MVLSVDARRRGPAARGLGGGHPWRTAADRPRRARLARRPESQLGAGEILLTSIDRDGTRSGYDLDLLAAVVARVPVPVIASGGGASVDDFAAALAAGASAVLAASVFHTGETTPELLKQALSGRGFPMRCGDSRP